MQKIMVRAFAAKGCMRLPVALLVALCTISPPAFAQAQVLEMASRPGVTVRFAYFPAANPVASAILFQGGAGNIGLYPNGSTRSGGFLATGAANFNRNDISVAIIDLPSDRRHLDDFRQTREHAEDAAVVIDFLRQRARLPVWAIGTSNGSLSAATSAAILKARGPDGLVLTASTTRKPISAAHPVTDAALNEIALPVLFVHHRLDGCSVTPIDAIPGVMASMKAAKPVELITVEGGDPAGNPCRTGHHQFVGIEAAVTQQIAEWIKRYQAQAPTKAGN